MFAVRRALRSWETLRPFLQQLAEAGEIDAALAQAGDLLRAFTDGHIETSLPDLAYRFVRDEEQLDVILSGTGNVEHLEKNYRSLTAPPLPEAVRDRLQRLFSRAVSSSAQ
jgi:aryl-alcohol dehydrogenase-like predicted oxidoreductase